MVYNYHDPLRVQSAGVDLEWKTAKQLVYCQNELDCHVESHCTDVDYVSGCIMIIRKEVCAKVGNLKENYFAYWEETEWCTRVKKAGNRVICANKAKAWHKEAATTTKNPGFVEYHITRNMFYFMKEHASKTNYRSFLLYFFGYHIFYMSGFYILKARDGTRLKYFWKGIIHGLLQNE
jgi:GT2 family glycosyltransferase